VLEWWSDGELVPAQVNRSKRRKPRGWKLEDGEGSAGESRPGSAAVRCHCYLSRGHYGRLASKVAWSMGKRGYMPRPDHWPVRRWGRKNCDSLITCVNLRRRAGEDGLSGEQGQKAQKLTSKRWGQKDFFDCIFLRER